MLTEISGIFVKIVFAEDAHLPLTTGAPNRPAARFNRPGQDALYLSPGVDSARVAIGEYVKEQDRPRVIVQYEIDRCLLFDLRSDDAAAIYELARQPWQSANKQGIDPPSWEAADKLRKAGHTGLIDPSRQQPGLWHITLFRWNEVGAPYIREIGTPAPIQISPKP
ncbi:MAG: RES family NAD+ phosphorylase [Sneathiella sp.]